MHERSFRVVGVCGDLGGLRCAMLQRRRLILMLMGCSAAEAWRAGSMIAGRACRYRNASSPCRPGAGQAVQIFDIDQDPGR